MVLPNLRSADHPRQWNVDEAASVLLGTAAVVGATPANAALTFCNKSPSSLEVAYAFSENDAPGTSTGGHRGVVARGWFKIARGMECALFGGQRHAAVLTRRWAC